MNTLPTHQSSSVGAKGTGKGKGGGHSDSEVKRRDVPYNTAPKTINKIAKNHENYENYEKLRS